MSKKNPSRVRRKDPWWKEFVFYTGGVFFIASLLGCIGAYRDREQIFETIRKLQEPKQDVTPLPAGLREGFAAIDGVIDSAWTDKPVYVPSDFKGLLSINFGSGSESPEWGRRQTYLELSGAIEGRIDASFATHGDSSYDGPKRAIQIYGDYHPMIMHIRIPIQSEFERQAINAHAVFEYTYVIYGQTSSGSGEASKTANLTIIPVSQPDFEIISLHQKGRGEIGKLVGIGILLGAGILGMVLMRLGR